MSHTDVTGAVPAAAEGRHWGSLAAAVIAALSLWVLFAPANMSPDSWVQYGEAVQASHANWHPPVMSIVLRLVLGCGGGLGTLMLIQCIAGVIGLRAASSATLRLGSQTRLSDRSAGWVATVVTLLILAPLTPTAFIFMTFWKDAWQAILMLWVYAASVALFLRADGLPRAAFGVRLSALVVLMAAFGLPRYNAVIVMPIFGALLATIIARRGAPRFLRFVVVPLPLVLSALGEAGIERAFHVRDSHRAFLIQVMDIVGMCAQNPKRLHDFPYVSRNLREGALLEYRSGEVRSIYIQGHFTLLAPELTREEAPNPELDAEYRRAMLQFPLEFARVKVTAFLRLLNPGTFAYDYFAPDCGDNKYGLMQSVRLEGLRRALQVATIAAKELPLLRWISSHALWFDVNLLAFGWALVRLRLKRSAHALLCLLLLAVPFCYSLSYLAATLDMDYRFIFPSTVLMLVMAASLTAERLMSARLNRSKLPNSPTSKLGTARQTVSLRDRAARCAARPEGQ